MTGYDTIEYGTVRCEAVRCGTVLCDAGFCGPWCWVWRVKYSSFGWHFLLISDNLSDLRISCRRTDLHFFRKG